VDSPARAGHPNRWSSSRNSSRRSETQRFEVPNPLAISTVEYPCEVEVATVRRIAYPRTESIVQSGIEWNEGRSWPFIGAAGELPAGAVVGALPVNRRALGCAVEEAAEAATPRIKGVGELPGDLEQPSDEVVSLVGSKARGKVATAYRLDEQGFLRFEDLDFEKGLIRVERSYDPKARVFVEPKSRAGRRTVPMAKVLRQYLSQARLETGRSTGLVFSVDGETVFDDRRVAVLATACWQKRKLEPVTLHECRHTFASLMIQAGVNVKALSAYMGHTSITITLDRYGHLLPGNEEEAASLLDAYLGVGCGFSLGSKQRSGDAPATARARLS
jgi:Phage integrase family